MKIVINEEELEQHVVKLLNDLPDNKVLLIISWLEQLKQKQMRFGWERYFTSLV